MRSLLVSDVSVNAWSLSPPLLFEKRARDQLSLETCDVCRSGDRGVAVAPSMTQRGPESRPGPGRRLGKRLRAKAAQLAREALARQILQGLVARSVLKGARARTLAAHVSLPWLALLVTGPPHSHHFLSQPLSLPLSPITILSAFSKGAGFLVRA